ncbi:MAG: hypoxanthine-guanine phosphoribosyltransferase [Chromatiales bacterium]|jgi:hypoxanthine phosphoribosyltransferase
MITPEHATEVMTGAQQLYSPSEVEQTLDRLAREISDRLAGTNPVVLCVLNGALIPMGHLLTRLAFPLRQDYIHATRYQGNTRGAELEWLGRPATPLAGETVLVVDDILDEGLTLAEIIRFCREAGAKSVYSAVLVEKRHARGNGFKADFVGLPVPDRYIFGFGMDYKGYLRNTPGIYAV